MSLRPDEKSRRSRSKSPGGRERSRSHAREPTASTPQYEYRQPEPVTMGNYSDLPPDQRPYAQQAQSTWSPGVAYAQSGNVQYSTPTTQPFNYTAAPSSTSHAGLARTTSTGGGSGFQYAQPPDRITFTATPASAPHAATTQPGTPAYTYPYPPPSPSQPQYTATAPQAPMPPPPSTVQPAYPPPPSRRPDHDRVPSQTVPHDDRRVVEMVPGGMLNAPPSPGPRPHSLSVSGRPDGLIRRMDRLSVSGDRPDMQHMHGGGPPPPSPLLEAYHGTYQSISPMVTPAMLDDDFDHLPSLDSLSPRAPSHSGHGRLRAPSTSRRSRSPSQSRHTDKLAMEAYGGGHRIPEKEKEKRRVRIYDATDDALAIVEAMAARAPDVETIVAILPALSHDQMLELRSEYKRHCKVQGRGINIAKHIKLKTSGNFGKIAYVTALGRYEAEGYWANYWYQSNSARRELLIEALLGRQNHEIREIKDAFKDKRYSDSLTRCMDKELKADKFRKAVLMALEGERQEESDAWPIEYVHRDADVLYKAMKAREGGESSMLGVVIMRSDVHLREVLRTYERKYQGNFARDALRKSNNLVGELIAHILNGVINRPARDSMLLHHALIDLMEPSPDGRLSSRESSTASKHQRQQRHELLISRLVRLHWDRLHMMRVKAEYEEKYGRVVEEDIEEATKGDFREFCIALCQASG